MLPELKDADLEIARPPETISSRTDADVLDRLKRLCAERGLSGIADNLADLMAVVGTDLKLLEDELDESALGERVAEKAGAYLLRQGGKRLRPLCVALAARAGSGFDARALDLAVAVELVHNATLLHDDVIDLATTRRGARAARLEFGNAASIFAGDWLLIEALQRVQRAQVPDTLEMLLATIAEMVRAESLQLENRGRLELSRELYFEIAEGKSATLFEWAMGAGGRAGGLPEASCEALEDFGRHLGVAFQVIDDVLDITPESKTGKPRFADLREGKITYPVIVALEKDPALATLLEEVVALDPLDEPKASTLYRIGRRVEDSGAIDDGRALAASRVSQAIEALAALPDSDATRALAAVAQSTVHRLL